MNTRNLLKTLLVLVLGLPLLQMVLVWVGGLLTAMGDATAAGVLQHINTTARVLWVVSVVALVVTLSIKSLDQQ